MFHITLASSEPLQPGWPHLPLRVAPASSSAGEAPSTAEPLVSSRLSLYAGAPPAWPPLTADDGAVAIAADGICTQLSLAHEHAVAVLAVPAAIASAALLQVVDRDGRALRLSPKRSLRIVHPGTCFGPVVFPA